MKPGRKIIRGVTLLETMLLVVILGVVFLGFGIGLTSSAHIPGAVDTRLAIHTRLVEKLEDIAALDFATVAAGASGNLSDTVTIGNTSYARTVQVATLDGDGDGNPDPDLLGITVTIAGQSLETRLVQP